MPNSNAFRLGNLLGPRSTILAASLAEDAVGGGGVTSYADMAALIAVSSPAPGDLALVQDVNKIFVYNGAGWFLIATVTNGTPSSITGIDASYFLANDGTPTVITAVSTDPEGFPLTWSYAVTTGSLGNTATVTQADNVFTITPSTDSANSGQFSITFSVTDGATGLVIKTTDFNLTFGWPVITGIRIYQTSSSYGSHTVGALMILNAAGGNAFDNSTLANNTTILVNGNTPTWGNGIAVTTDTEYGSFFKQQYDRAGVSYYNSTHKSARWDEAATNGYIDVTWHNYPAGHSPKWIFITGDGRNNYGYFNSGYVQFYYSGVLAPTTYNMVSTGSQWDFYLNLG
jgi:hypothetical protein